MLIEVVRSSGKRILIAAETIVCVNETASGGCVIKTSQHELDGSPAVFFVADTFESIRESIASAVAPAPATSSRLSRPDRQLGASENLDDDIPF